MSNGPYDWNNDQMTENLQKSTLHYKLPNMQGQSLQARLNKNLVWLPNNAEEAKLV